MVGLLSLIEGAVWPPQNSKGIVEPLLRWGEDRSTTNESLKGGQTMPSGWGGRFNHSKNNFESDRTTPATFPSVFFFLWLKDNFDISNKKFALVSHTHKFPSILMPNTKREYQLKENCSLGSYLRMTCWRDQVYFSFIIISLKGKLKITPVEQVCMNMMYDWRVKKNLNFFYLFFF
jgi:hypothetical protein